MPAPAARPRVARSAGGLRVATWRSSGVRGQPASFCFTSFFYVLSPNIWGVVFLLLGLLSIQDFWGALKDQIQSFFQHSLNWTIDATQSRALFAGIIVLILLIATISAFFALTFVQITSMAFVYALKFAISINVLRASDNKICCAEASDSAQCPFWLTHTGWIMVVAAFFFRLVWGKWLNRWFQIRQLRLLRNKYAEVSTTDETEGTDTRDASGAVSLSINRSEEGQPSDTKKRKR